MSELFVAHQDMQSILQEFVWKSLYPEAQKG